MIALSKKLALILVLSFFTANADHHAHDKNHQDHHSHSDVLSAFDHHFHEYHHHHPIEQPNCGQICPKSLPRFQQFEVGQVYTVEMDGQTIINVKEGHTIDLKTKIDVHVLSPCEFTLKLRDSKVSGVPNPQELSQQLDSSPILRFGAHDGKVLGVCPAPEEDIWTLNVKKSILSAMQLTTKDLSAVSTVEEVDFSGHCTTTYRPLSDTSDPTNVLIEKTKNLNKCHLRRKNISGFQSKSLTLLTEFLRENLPILRSTQRCLQEIKSGHLFTVKCLEEQKVLMNDESVVMSTLNLRFAGKAPAANPVPAGPIPQNAETLLMTRDDEGQKITNEADVLALVKVMCSQVSGDTLSSEVTESFHSLVRALRSLPEAGTRTLDKVVKSGEICQSPKLRHLFLGASTFAASDPSIQTLINAYNSKELTKTQATLVLSVVALKTQPSEKTIDQLVPLIQPKDSERGLMLSVSLMVRNYCKKTEKCEESAAVKKTIEALLNKLRETDCNLEKITAIKALDNIRPKTAESVKNALLEWAQNSEADSGIRVAAIQALQRLADDNIRQKLNEILLKDNEPTEVRITAYRAVVLSGATPQQLETIKSVSDSQIQNYIRSHIKNLKKSSRNNLLPPNAPAFEDPKSTGLGVTRNSGFSYKNISMEVDIIHPKGSLIPSLYTFGVWFPIGGKEYQLLEVQVRQQGLSQHMQKLISKGIGGPEILMQLSEELLELLAHLKDPNHKHSVILQVSVRMSGKNILFVDTFEDMHQLVVLIKDRMKELYGTEKIDIARGISLLDSQVEVPSLMGFPMLVNLNETIIVAMKAEHTSSEAGGNKLRKGRSSRTYLDEVSAGLKLKVKNYRPGFEYHIRFEMRPSTDAQVERIDGRILKAKINLPDERKTLMKLTQNTRLIDANGVTKETNEIEGRSATDDSTHCRQLFGMNVCRTRTWLSNSPIPNVEYYVTKQDPSLDSIELILEKPAATERGDLLVWSAKVNAGKREYLGQFELQNPKEGIKKVNLKLVSPKRTITAETSLQKSSDGNVSKMEVDLKIPNVIDINTKYDVEKKGEESNVQILSEYQLPGSDRKETLKWNRKSSLSYKKEKKSKQINASFMGELQSSQFPKYNSKVSYSSSFKPYQNSQSDLKVEWGPQLNDRVRLLHTSKMDVLELRPFQMVSENLLVVEATPLKINYDFKLNSDISMIKSNPKLISLDLVGKDVEGRPDRDIKGSLKYERVEQPAQQIMNASLSYPGREMSYYSEVKQIKDLTFAGKMFYSPQKGKVITIEHKESVTNPTKDFHMESEAEVSFSYKPDKLKIKTEMGWDKPEKFAYKHTVSKDDKKYNEWDISYDKKSNELELEMTSKDRRVELKVDNIKSFRSAQWGMKYGPKSYKFSATRVPKESISLKLDSSENSRLKEFKAKISRKEKSTLKLVTNENLEINGYLDPISKEKRAHLEVKCPKHQMDHIGDIIVNPKERKVTWDSKTNKDGKPYITLESQFSPKDRTFIILKKTKGPDAVSKFEYFYDKGVYGAALDTSRWSAVLEGECRNNKNFGKLGFVDKIDNYEHKSQYNVSNGIITVKSISDKEKQTFTKLDAVIGRKIISNISLITPKINAQLTANPLAEKKTLVFKLVSPRYDQNSNIEWVPRKYLKLDSMSHRKVEPEKKVKVDAYLTRDEESNFRMTAPALDVDIKRVKTPKPKYIFNTTINGYNEVQEFDSNPSLTPIHNLMIALKKYFESYTSNN